MTPSSWIQRPDTYAPRRVYERRLGRTEFSFYLDGRLSGASDTIQHDLVQVFPLLGAQISLDAGGSSGQFVVHEEGLRSCKSSEVHVYDVDGVLAVERLLLDLLNGPRRLNTQTLSQVYVLQRIDSPSHCHVIFHVAHTITDGMSNFALLEYFMDSLCAARTTPGLEERLVMALSSEELDPCLHLSLPRQRWMRAISEVIKSIRWDKLKGGHVFPQIQDPTNPTPPPTSNLAKVVLSEHLSKKVFATCRRLSLTFGHAYTVLMQIAMTRVLCRQYIRGHMSRDEWEMRRRQPMHIGAAVNLRPYLDKEWLKKGSRGIMTCAVGFYQHTLPFMPLGLASDIGVGDPLPSFADLLSRDRFLFRTKLLKKQYDHIFRHPSSDGVAKPFGIREVVPETKTASGQGARSERPFVFSLFGSGVGDIAAFVQYKYPSRKGPESKSQTPLLRIITTETYIRCRSGEFYSLSATSQNVLHMKVFFDGTTYEESVVEEWLNDVKEAAIWYLGQEREDRSLESRL